MPQLRRFSSSEQGLLGSRALRGLLGLELPSPACGAGSSSHCSVAELAAPSSKPGCHVWGGSARPATPGGVAVASRRLTAPSPSGAAGLENLLTRPGNTFKIKICKKMTLARPSLAPAALLPHPDPQPPVPAASHIRSPPCIPPHTFHLPQFPPLQPAR